KKINHEKTEYQKYLEEICDPNYQGGSWALPENPTPLEQAKYEICKQVVSYKLDTKISTEEMAQKLQLSKDETEDILYYRIDYFTLDRLVSYATRLFKPFEEKLNEAILTPEPKKNPNWKRDHYVVKRIPFGEE
ncbi:10984_t:CDS:2, partial [Ambispora leptoticha]